MDELFDTMLELLVFDANILCSLKSKHLTDVEGETSMIQSIKIHFIISQLFRLGCPFEFSCTLYFFYFVKDILVLFQRRNYPQRWYNWWQLQSCMSLWTLPRLIVVTLFRCIQGSRFRIMLYYATGQTSLGQPNFTLASSSPHVTWMSSSILQVSKL